MERQLNKIREQFGRGLALMLGRGIITSVDDTGALQAAQIDRLADETADDLECFGNYGHYSNPPAGSEAIVASLGGVRSHGVIIAVENRQYRLKAMQTGEVAMSDDLGQVVYLTRDGIRISSSLPVTIHSDENIALDAPEVTVTANTITLDADQVTMTGDVSIGGDFDVEGNWKLGAGANKALKHIDDTPTTTGVAK